MYKRQVLRLSGTGTQGATLRAYYDCYQDDPGLLELSPQKALADLIEVGSQVARIAHVTGRSKPDVVT